MRELKIYKRYFYESDCYKGAYKQAPEGIQVHSTGANNPWLRRYVGPDDGRIGKNQYNNHSNRPGRTVCASAYIGKMADGTVAVYQTLPWNYRCWLSGSASNGNANKMGYIGFEICEDSRNDKAYFDKAVMEVSVNLTAHLCKLIGKKPDDIIKEFPQGKALTVMDHSELHALKLASNHADIQHWLKMYGLTMGDYRNAVQEAMNEGVFAQYIDCDKAVDVTLTSLYTATATPTGSYLNIRAGKSAETQSLGKLRKGDKVEVLDDSDASWWAVRSGNVAGYAMTGKDQKKWLVKDEEQNAGTLENQEQEQSDESAWSVVVNGLTKTEAFAIASTYPDATAFQTRDNNF